MWIHLVLFLIFIIIIIFLIVIGIRAKRLKNHIGFINSIFPAGILILSIILYIIKFYQVGQFLLVFPLDLILVCHFLFMVGIQQIYVYRVKHSKDNKKSVQLIIKDVKEFTLDQEGGRKVLHLLGFLIIPPYFGMGVLYYNTLRAILDFFNAPSMNIRSELIPQTIALLGILTAFIFVTIPEMYRIYNHNYCLLQRFMHVLRKEEINAVGPHVNTMVGVIIPIILISEPYLAVGTIFSGIMADAAASIIGKKWGKIIFKKKNNKTIEGLIGGVIIGFFTSFIFYIFNYPIYLCIIFSLICCIIFGLLDFLSFSISDNILNPILSGIAISLANSFILI